MRLIYTLLLLCFTASAHADFKSDLEGELAKEHDLDHVVVKFYNGKGLSQNNNINILSVDSKGNKFEARVENSLGKKISVSGRFYSAILLPAFIKNMKSGKIIKYEDVGFIKVAQSKSNNQYINSREDLANKAIRVNLAKNKPIKRRDVMNKIMVSKGDNIKVLFNKNNLAMEVLAQALESGGIGESIRVKNLDSNKSLQARILDAQTVRVGE